jgi:tRNA(Ile)-lysidine synthase
VAELLSQRLGLAPVCVVPVTVDGPGGPEASARAARREALARTAAATGAGAILLGHTLDDQAETVLLRLARGAGARSLAGMRERDGVWRRPLLGLRRAQVRQAAVEAGLPVWEDPHNTDRSFTRVRVRYDVLPALEQALGPGVVPALARSAHLLAADADLLDAHAAAVGTQLDPQSQGRLEVAALAAQPEAIRLRVLRQALVAAGAPAGKLTAAHVQQVDRLVTDWHGQGPLALPGGLGVRRWCGTLELGGSSGSGAPPDDR